MMPIGIRKAFAYCRVSTEGQTDGDGFPRQKQAVRDYAQANGIQIVRFFEEDVSGADDSIDRPVFTELQNALDSNGTKLVLIEKLDRLARSVRVQENIIYHFQEAGWEIISTKEPDLCSKEPEHALFRELMGMIAEYDRANIVRRLKNARDRNSKALGRRVEGRKKKIALHPEEQAALPRMHKLQAQGQSYNAIALTLNAEGISAHKPTSGRKSKAKKYAVGQGIWYAASVRRVLAVTA
jgi:DNA invertase Pin-like site-specific DNA recombinase